MNKEVDLSIALSDFVCEYLSQRYPDFNLLDDHSKMVLVERIATYIMKMLSFITEGRPFDA